jgi:hypothetical protein
LNRCQLRLTSSIIAGAPCICSVPNLSRQPTPLVRGRWPKAGLSGGLRALTVPRESLECRSRRCGHFDA